jgi:hypothetical protein
MIELYPVRQSDQFMRSSYKLSFVVSLSYSDLPRSRKPGERVLQEGGELQFTALSQLRFHPHQGGKSVREEQISYGSPVAQCGKPLAYRRLTI